MTRDPNSFIAASAEHLAETLTKKNSDYAPTGEFSNFEKAAEFSGSRTLGVMLGQIAIKYTRIETLSRDVYNPSPQYESLQDSLLDLAGYAVIAHAYLAASEIDDAPTEYGSVIADTFITDREIIRNLVDDDHEHACNACDPLSQRHHCDCGRWWPFNNSGGNQHG